MPFVAIESSAQLRVGAEPSAVCRQAAGVVADALGKPPSMVMVRLNCASPAQPAVMYFADSTEPCSYFHIQGIGEPSAEQLSALCAGLCALALDVFGIAETRSFVVYSAVPRSHWGLNSRMLG